MKLADNEGVAYVFEEADVLLIFQVANKFVGVVIVTDEYGVALEGVEEVPFITDDVVRATFDGL